MVSFWSNVFKTTGCWEWLGKTQTAGYGQCWTGYGGERLAHRVSWIIHFGLIPEDLQVLHKCDNKTCVNPNHLYLGTQTQNVQDNVDRNLTNVGSKHWSTNLQDSDIRCIRFSFRQGTSINAIAARFKLSYKNVWAIVHRYKWKHIPEFGTSL
jgi:hypothetical protein